MISDGHQLPTGCAKKNNLLGIILFFAKCSRFSHQMYIIYRAAFRIYIQLISLAYNVWLH